MWWIKRDHPTTLMTTERIYRISGFGKKSGGILGEFIQSENIFSSGKMSQRIVGKSGNMSWWEIVGWEQVRVGLCHSEKMSEWESVVVGYCRVGYCRLGYCRLGNCRVGKCPGGKVSSGKMSSGKMSGWESVEWESVEWENVSES